jgi:hypothetical protein
VPVISKDLIRSVARDLRKAGISARASRKNGAVLFLPKIGPDGVAALRMLHPVLQTLPIQTGLVPQIPKKK